MELILTNIPLFCSCFEGIEDDEDLEEADLETAIKAIKKKGGKIHQKVSDNKKNTPEKKSDKAKKNPEKNEVTLEMVIETFAKEFNGFLLPVAEENFIRGYKQALSDVEAGEKMFAEYAESKQDD